MQLVEINTVSAKTLEACLARGAQMRWPPVPTPLAGAWPCQAALGRNDQPSGSIRFHVIRQPPFGL
jgi:hypothetical protein